MFNSKLYGCDCEACELTLSKMCPSVPMLFSKQKPVLRMWEKNLTKTVTVSDLISCNYIPLYLKVNLTIDFEVSFALRRFLGNNLENYRSLMSLK